MVGRSVGQNKKKEWTLEKVWVPEKARLLSKKAWLQSQLENEVFSTIKYLNQKKSVVSMLIKNKNITSCQLLLTKQDRVLLN